MNNKHKPIEFITQGALIAALYVVFTLISTALGLTGLAVQIRFSEALCVLACFTPAAVPGLGLGCVLTNLILQSAPLDTVFGSLATFMGALVCWAVSSYLNNRGMRTAALWLSPAPNIIANTLILPFIIKWVYLDSMPLWLIALLVLAGEAASSCLGLPLAFGLEKRRIRLYGE